MALSSELSIDSFISSNVELCCFVPNKTSI